MNKDEMRQKIEFDAQRIITNTLNTVSTLSRGSLLGGLTDQMGNHDIDQECGYPNQLTPEVLWRWFKREDMAYRMVLVKPEACWSSQPTIRENNDAEQTPFELAIETMNKKVNLWNYLKRADVVSGVGDFGVLMLGIDDGLAFEKPVAGVDLGTKGTGRATKKHELKYLRTFAQHQVQIERVVNDPKNPRFGLPEMYKLTFESDDSLSNSGGVTHTESTTTVISQELLVHWTRVVHLADNRDTSDIFGNSRLQRIYNRLIDLRKIVGGSGEMYWKGAFPGLALESQPDFADAEFDKEATKKAVDDYQQGLNRYLAIQGISIKSLEPQIVDPSNHYKMLIMAIATCEGIPYRVLLGAEEGKQAGGQDVTQWNTKMEGRRDQYVSPLIIRPVIDRLIAMNVLDEVDYCVKWDTLNEQTLQEQITNSLNRTKALAEYMRGGVDQLVILEDYLKLFLKMDDSEVKTIVDNMTSELLEDREDPENDVTFDPNGNRGGQQTKLDEDKI